MHWPVCLSLLIVAGDGWAADVKKTSGPAKTAAEAMQWDIKVPEEGNGILVRRKELVSKLEARVAELRKQLEGAAGTGAPANPELERELDVAAEELDRESEKLTQNQKRLSDRRKRQKKELEHWRKLLGKDAAQRVLTNDAERTAQLKRIRYLAIKDQDAELVGRAQLALAAQEYLVREQLTLLSKGTDAAQFLPAEPVKEPPPAQDGSPSSGQTAQAVTSQPTASPVTAKPTSTKGTAPVAPATTTGTQPTKPKADAP